MTAVTATSGSHAATATMRAIVQDRYGPPDVLHVADVPIPEIGDDGILVRVNAVSLNAADWHLSHGVPFLARMGNGLRRPSQPTPGIDVAGVVEAVGTDVTELSVGDEVFGTRSGCLAEYVAGRLRNFALKPENLTFEEAAAMPVAAETALQALRNHGRLQRGQRVLVLGSGGGVGIYTVQIAKALGGHVTAETAPDKVAMLQSLGADDVIDYGTTDITKSGRRFDLVVDVGGYRTLRSLRRMVTAEGTIVHVGAGSSKLGWLISGIVAGLVRERLLKQRIRSFLAKTNRDDLLTLRELAVAGKIRPVIDRIYSLDQVPEAMRYLESGTVGGKLVVRL
jgi:NADPH:quinone reductase-like Zn-dependent oxidoreductase